ncbi:MAG: type IV pilus twitching motility protein PilT [Candidatus Eisenbacteria bacterium]|uniref:Type IV pilus twitching motility protein PilT n=1 Tax=Eiseniibacteriota bacterium TaxID=2212470 RepID=A0A956RQW0_UNCEI|nr:type IV pilus twitching motility protein PilT [Candidatus Eisenbacteria bacterium]
MVKEQGASDLHISTGAPPMLRIHGEIHPIDYPELEGEQARQLLYELMTPDQKSLFHRDRDIDFGYEVPGEVRVRCNLYEQLKGISGAFRLLPSQIFTIEQLGLPDQVQRFCDLEKGLVVVTGPPGSGKSTTLAAILNHINQNQRKHVLTIEDPVEYVHPNLKCLFNQREVGRSARSFAAALRAALREDPNIILVGEMRDLETMHLALTAAETGQLVLATLHTQSASQTVDRIINAFPEDQQAQIRVMLSESLKGVVAQRLVRKASGDGRVAALEILFCNTAISSLIRERKTFQIPSVMQTSRRDGMLLLDNCLMQLVKDGQISAQDAYRAANQKELFASLLQKAGQSGSPTPGKREAA